MKFFKFFAVVFAAIMILCGPAVNVSAQSVSDPVSEQINELTLVEVASWLTLFYNKK